MKKYGTFPFYGNGFLNNNGYAQIVQSTVGGGAIDAPSNVSRRTVWRKNHLKRRSFLVASSSPPWLNLYFCCSATKIKEKYNVLLADIHGSKSVRITSWLPTIFYFQSTHFHFLLKMKIFHIRRSRIFHTRSVFHIFAEAKIFHVRRSRIYKPRPMGEVSAHECADDGAGIITPYATASRVSSSPSHTFSSKNENISLPKLQNSSAVVHRSCFSSFFLFLYGISEGSDLLTEGKI